jgi:superfamily II RNA helicase
MDLVNVKTGECLTLPENPPIKFSYEPDHFQKHAFHCISRGEDVLATAHTGSGKTTIGEYAIMETIRNGKVCVYTSPIKSLSNEKFNDFRHKFKDVPNFSLGIMTGDNKINPNGNVVIMTAEILRNALYRIKKEQTSDVSLADDFVDKIGCVIMDEIHYINSERGSVWEETIVLLDESVQLIGLSATIDKAEDFVRWISSVRQKKINLIPTSFRAVPLRHYIFSGQKLHMIYDKDFMKDNYLKSKKDYELQKLTNKKFNSLNSLTDLIRYLKDNDLFQTIFFSFSKKNCEHYASTIQDQLVDHEELKRINNIFDSHMFKYDKEYSKLTQYQTVKQLINKGVAFHHAGLLPILKEIIEMLFKEKLIKILFATETFAVGVNMPTRTVVFMELEKFTSKNKRFLTPAEYTQMSGRAGRRGIDTLGNVIILPLYDFIEELDLKNMLLGKVRHIESQFKIDYQFVLKALQSNVTDINDFMKKSLFYDDTLLIIKGIKFELEIQKQELSLLSVSDVSENCKKLFDLENNFEFEGMKIMVSKQQQKNYQNLKRSVDQKEFEKYKFYMNKFKKLKQTERSLSENETFIENNIALVLNILKKYNFINDKQEILQKAIIASQINECNSLLLTEMLIQKYFNDLSAEEIVGLLAIFIESENEEDDLGYQGTPKIRKRIHDIKEIINDYVSSENKLGLYNDQYSEISTAFIDSAYDWVCGKPFSSEIYIGSFIRNMIKINNLAKDMIHLCQLIGNIDIIPILSTIESKIIRDFVTVNSLYLS